MNNKFGRGVASSFAVFALGILDPGLAHATGTDRALIVDLTIEGANFARISLSVAPNFGGSRPACHNSAYTTHYVIDTSTTKGKTLFSALQAAQLSGKFITVTGTNACTSTGIVSLEAVGNLTVWTN